MVMLHGRTSSRHFSFGTGRIELDSQDSPGAFGDNVGHPCASGPSIPNARRAGQHHFRHVARRSSSTTA